MVLGLADMTGKNTENRRREVATWRIALRQPCPKNAQIEWDMGISAVGTNASTRLGSWRALGRSDSLKGVAERGWVPWQWRSSLIAVVRVAWRLSGEMIWSLWFLVIPCLDSFTGVGSGVDGIRS